MRSEGRIVWAVTAAALAFAPLEAAAQLTGEQAATLADSERSNLPPSTFGGVATFGGIGDDFFLNLNLRLNMEFEMWGFGLQLPMRLRIIDRDPKNDDDFFGILRREDWDQPSEFLRVIRFVYVGQRDKKGPFYVRVGELSGLTLGYGTIMHRYYNGIDASRWRTGVNAAVNIDAYGAEALVGDALDPYLTGARFTVRPLQIAMGEGLWEMLVVGASAVTDWRAPFELAMVPVDPAMPDGATQLVLDEDGVPDPSRRRGMAVFGLDLGVELVSTDLLSITPYTALNKMTVVDNGWGWHAGVLWGLRVPAVIDTLVVDLRTEYQRVSHDYRGPYFNTVYEIERYQLLADQGGGARPKLRVLSDLEGGGKNGAFFELLAGFPNWIFIGGEYLNYTGPDPDGSLRLSLEVPALEFVQFSAFYYRINIDGTDDLFALDDKSAVVAQAIVPFASFLYAQLRWWRVWQPDGVGGYQSVDDWSVGVGVSLEI